MLKMDSNRSKVFGVRLRSQAKANTAKLEENLTDNSAKARCVVLKREAADEDFTEYAETAMNEMLGWYGYTNNNKKETNKKLETRQSPNDASENDKTDTIILDQEHTRESRRSSEHSSDSEPIKMTEMCAWCSKSVDDISGISSNDAYFCSELCFSQSRRANFKKNKTCDWCKHVRHTVSYVDFQDGASQLQFCSDKCLNQYKMHIFCRETRAHLEMHPHLLTDETTSGLITPDLWMRNCRSPNSRATSPVHTQRLDELQSSPLPLITVAHPSKLLPVVKKDQSHSKRKRLRKRTVQATQKAEIAQDLRIRRQVEVSCTDPPATELCANKVYPELAARLCPANNNSSSCWNNTQRDAELQQRRANLPTYSNQTTLEAPTPLRVHDLNCIPTRQPELLNSQVSPSAVHNSGILPPVTVMVPYPVLVPVPIPIPIPLPMSVFLQAANLRERSYHANVINGTGLTSDNGPHMTYEKQSSQKTDSNNLGAKDSDEEEIVVDDDSRLHIQNITEFNTDADMRDNEHGFTPIRLKKRKATENTTTVRIVEHENYKQKKSLSV